MNQKLFFLFSLFSFYLTLTHGQEKYSDYNGDGKSDIAFIQSGVSQSYIGVLYSEGDGYWMPNKENTPFWVNQPGVISIPGDYNGDGKTDIAFYKPGSDWRGVPILFCKSDGSWDLKRSYAPPVPITDTEYYRRVLEEGLQVSGLQSPSSETIAGSLRSSISLSPGIVSNILQEPKIANEQNVIAIPGDYDGDGISDIAFYKPGSDWKKIPIYNSKGDGTWKIDVRKAPDWVNQPGVIAIPGDYDGDGRSDIAFYKPGSDWQEVPVLFAQGIGSWSPKQGVAIPEVLRAEDITEGIQLQGSTVLNQGSIPTAESGGIVYEGFINIKKMINEPNVKVMSGDYNGDGRTDLAFHQPGGDWNKLPILFSNGIGSWTVRKSLVPNWVNQEGTTAITGQFNNDNKTDIAFQLRGKVSGAFPVLLSNGDGYWQLSEDSQKNTWATWANRIGAEAISGDYNNDGYTDFAFYKPASTWNGVPILLSKGDGSWENKNSLGISPYPKYRGTLNFDPNYFISHAVRHLLDVKPWNIYFEIQKLYTDLNTVDYRRALFLEFQEIRESDVNTLLNRLIILINYLEGNYADGLEPLLFAYFDAIAIINDFHTNEFLKEVLSQYSSTWQKYKDDPHINIPMPLGRLNTPVVVDIRADAFRELLRGYDYDQSPFQSIPTLESLLDDPNTQDRLCEMPSIMDSYGEIIGEEIARKEDCESGNPPLGNNSLETYTMGGCLNFTGSESLQLINMMDCFAKVMEPTLGSENPGPDIGNFFIWALGGLGTWMMFITEAYNKVQETLTEVQNKYENYRIANREYLEELEKDPDSEETQIARKNLIKSKQAFRTALTNYESALNTFVFLSVTYSFETVKAAKDYIKALRAIINRPIPEKPNHPGEMDVVNKAKELKECICQNYSTEECNQLFPGNYFEEMLNGDRKPLDLVINPNPEGDPTEEELTNSIFNMGLCGLDFNTNRGGSACTGLVVCEFGIQSQIPDDDCSCSNVPTDQEKAKAQQWANASCAAFLNCPDGKVAVIGANGCTCITEGGTMEPELPPGPPVDLWNKFFFNADLKQTNNDQEKLLKSIFFNSNHPYQLREWSEN